MTETEIREIAADLASLEKALADQGFQPARVTAILSGAAGAIVTNVTSPLRYADAA